MKIILKTNVPKLGVAGEICEVKKGYAKNYLIPQGLAILAIPKAIAEIKVKKKEIEVRKTKEIEKFQDKLEKISGISLKIKVPVGEKQEMFAAIREKDIAEVLEKEKKIELDPDFINLKAPLKELGKHDIEVDFGEGLKANFQLIIEEKK